MSTAIQKRSGTTEPFDIERVRKSLERSGVPDSLIESVLAHIGHNPPKNTAILHNLIITYLNKAKQESLAARYNLKTALFELGPAGFPFEQFIARLLKEQHFTTQTDVTLQGNCVSHEVDIIAHSNDISYLVECKFHNTQGVKSDVKVPLYIKARFEDIKQFNMSKKPHTKMHIPWCVTNTEFTAQAIQYGTCQNMRMLDWKFPEKESLSRLIDQYGLHPITALTTLSLKEKQLLIQQGLILCKDAAQHRTAFKKLGFSQDHIDTLITQAQQVTLSQRT